MSPPPAEDTTAILALAREGDLTAFSQVMEAEQPRLMAQALVFCADPHLAEDLVQETMIAAWKGLHRFDGSCRFFTWLYVILLRQHRRSLGWFSRRLPLATPEQRLAAEAAEAAERRQGREADAQEPTVAEGSDILRAMVAALPGRHREVLRLRFYAGASESEIAAALGIAPGTVKSRLHNALGKLRRMKEKMNRLREAAH